MSRDKASGHALRATRPFMTCTASTPAGSHGAIAGSKGRAPWIGAADKGRELTIRIGTGSMAGPWDRMLRITLARKGHGGKSLRGGVNRSLSRPPARAGPAAPAALSGALRRGWKHEAGPGPRPPAPGPRSHGPRSHGPRSHDIGDRPPRIRPSGNPVKVRRDMCLECRVSGPFALKGQGKPGQGRSPRDKGEYG